LECRVGKIGDWGGDIWEKMAGKERSEAPSSRAAAPNPRGRTGSTRVVPSPYNGAGRGDMMWEHEPASSIRETTTWPSVAVGGVFLKNFIT
jgi:hypothetical protein